MTRPAGKDPSVTEEPLEFAQSILDAAPPLVVLDREYRVQMTNSAFRMDFCPEPQEVAGQGFFELGHGQWDTAEFHQLLDDTVVQEHVRREEEIRQDLNPCKLLVDARRIEYPRGKPGRFLLLFERLSSGRSKPERRKDFEASVIDSLEDSIVTVDFADIITSWNKGSERLYGYSAREAIGKPLAMLLIEADKDEVLAGMAKIRQGQKIQMFDTVRLCTNGELREFSMRLSPIMDAAGQIIGVSALARDISEGKRAQRSLLDSESRFRQLAETIPQLVWTCSPEGQCDYISPQWGVYTGIPSGAQLEKKWIEVVHPEDREHMSETWQTSAARKQPFGLEYRLRNRCGEYRWFSVRGVPICDESGRILKWFGTCTDIQESKTTQAGLETLVHRRTADLRETVKQLEAFSYSIAHDLRAPLRAINSFAVLLAQAYGERLDAQGLQMLERIQSAAERLDILVCDVLRYTRVGRDRAVLEPVDLDKLNRELLATYPGWEPPTADVRIEGRLPVVLGHKGFLTQCIANLVGNAIKFVAPGHQPKVRISAESTSGRVRLKIQDNGIGIEPEHRGRIFGMFERIHPASEYEGTGIGLAIVRTAAERMGGEVGFESEPGRGSIFWVELNGVPPEQNGTGE